MSLALTVSRSTASLPVTGLMGAIRRWQDVSGFSIRERGRDGHGVRIWCCTDAAAVRITVALFEGRHDLVDQILLAEQAPDFCVEDRSVEFRALCADGRVTVRRPRRRKAVRS